MKRAAHFPCVEVLAAGGDVRRSAVAVLRLLRNRKCSGQEILKSSAATAEYVKMPATEVKWRWVVIKDSQEARRALPCVKDLAAGRSKECCRCSPFTPPSQAC